MLILDITTTMDTNDNPASTKLSIMLMTITAVMLAVTSMNTVLVTIVVWSSSVSVFLVTVLAPLIFLSFKSINKGTEKLEYPSISSPLQFTKASKKEAKKRNDC